MKPIYWVGGSRKELAAIPSDPRHDIRAALIIAQSGATSSAAKRMKGDLRDATEIIARSREGTFRGIYYAASELIYALHFFQKKSNRGIETPKAELDLIRRRLAWSRNHEKEGR